MKKNNFFTLIPVCLILAFVSTGVSCRSMPRLSLPWIDNSSSWSVPSRQNIAGTVWISGIEVDKAGLRSSIESETSALLPLLLLERNYLVLEERENADFIVEVKVREREYINGWKTVCSMGVEVYFRQGKNHEALKEGTAIPLAAAHTVRESSRGLSSSRNLRRLLASAVKEAINALEKNNNV